MMNDLEEFAKRISNFISSSNGASRVLINVKGHDLKTLFLHKFFEEMEEEPEFDAFWLNTEGESIGVQEVKRMANFLAYAPSNAERRYVIAEEFSNASREATAAILKITEEPPDYAVFLFFTSNVLKLLATVRSRFTTFYLKVNGISLLEEGFFQKWGDTVPKSYLEDPNVALYVSRFLDDVKGLFSLHNPTEACEELANLVNEKRPAFLAQIAAEKVLISVKMDNFFSVFSDIQTVLKKESTLVLEAFFNAAVVILQDLAVLKKSNYWRGVKRKNYMEDYLDFRIFDVSTFEWVLACRTAIRKTKVNASAAIGLLLAKFVSMKTGSDKF